MFENKKEEKSNDLFGKSITKEILQQSKNEIKKDGLDAFDDDFNADKKKKQSGKNNLEIEIDENADIEK